MKPLAIDLFCGLGGWTEGLLAEGYRVVGFDIERHVYGDQRYPAQLVLQDALTIHGKQFKDAALIVASPPCQEYSYMAMPWSKAKQKRAEYLNGTRDVKQLTALFDACFRIQREAIEAAGHHIPMVVENVRGANEWVGRSRWNFGSFHLWGDVPALMPIPKSRHAMKQGIAHRSDGATNFHQGKYDVQKVPGFRFDGSGKSFQTASVEGVKGVGRSMNKGAPKWSMHDSGHMAEVLRDGIKQGEGVKAGAAYRWPCSGCGVAQHTGSKSNARKAASAQIAKIPFVLSSHIARVYKP